MSTKVCVMPKENPRDILLTSLVKLLEDVVFTDVTLKLRDGQVQSSRFLLASLSPVFRDVMASAGLEVNLNVSREIWDFVSRFYLCGDIQLTTDNVLAILKFAREYKLDLLDKHCSYFMWRNFATISKSQQFRTLSKEEVLQLLSNPGVPTTEESLCDDSLQWLLDHGVGDSELIEMMDNLKLDNLSNEYICAILTNETRVYDNRTLRHIFIQEVRRRLDDLCPGQ